MKNHSEYNDTKKFGCAGKVLTYQDDDDDSVPVAFLSRCATHFVRITSESQQIIDELMIPFGDLNKPKTEPETNINVNVDVNIKPDQPKPDVAIIDHPAKPEVEKKQPDAPPTTGGVTNPVVNSVTHSTVPAIASLHFPVVNNPIVTSVAHSVPQTNTTDGAIVKSESNKLARIKNKPNPLKNINMDEEFSLVPRKITNIKAKNVNMGPTTTTIVHGNVINNYYGAAPQVDPNVHENLKQVMEKVSNMEKVAATMGVNLTNVAQKQPVDLKNLMDYRTDYAGRTMQLPSFYMVLPRGQPEYTPVQLAVVLEKPSQQYYTSQPIEYYEYFASQKGTTMIPGKDFRRDYRPMTLNLKIIVLIIRNFNHNRGHFSLNQKK
ncbi:Hypothetical protein FSTVST1_293 [Faustovirus ST1]|nr:Hypothetical protein FSTVST1_293 [Faustovirus ST1]